MAPNAAPLLVDKESFFKRLKRVYTAWKNAKSTEGESNFSTVDAIVVGLVEDENKYKKSLAFNVWLFGYELFETTIVLCENSIHILASQKKYDFMKPLQTASDEVRGPVPAVKLYVRGKSDGGKENFPALIAAIKASRKGKVIGEFSKDDLGDTYKAWLEELADAGFSGKSSRFDISQLMAYIMAPKDEKELSIMKRSAQCTTDLFKKYYWEEVMGAVDKEKKVKHSKIADGLDEEGIEKKAKALLGLPSAQDVSMCYPPIIQSGGKINIKFSVTSDDEVMRFGVICASFGVRYKFYCTNIARTIMVAPTKSQLEAYNVAYELEEHVIKNLKPGVRLCDVYAAGVTWLKANKPALVENLKKSFGFATGLEFRESFLVISEKTTTMARKGMAFWVEVGLTELKNAEGKTDAEKSFGIWLGDTVVVSEIGPAQNLTSAARKKATQVSIMVENEEKASKNGGDEITFVPENPAGGRSRRTAVIDDRLRSEFSNEEKRKKHQEELAAQINQNALARLVKGKGEVAEPRLKKSAVSYRNIANFPVDEEVKQLQIYVDKKTETLILPLFGVPVPFHISFIKSVAQSVEGDYTYLRINFNHPGAAVVAGQEKHLFPHPEAQFLKELTFRSSNTKEPGELTPASANLTNTFRLVKELQKKYKTREIEEREQEGVIKQDTLVINPTKNQPRLKDLFIRPPLSQKRISGALEAHQNGFRYTTLRGEKVDILYNNIKHAIFQPPEGEMILLLHFHLKNAIVFQKRKIVDIQFYTEVGEMTTDLGKHYHMHDRDDLASEQAERELRNKLSAAFKTFTDKVETITDRLVDFDSPYRDLAFPGVPFRSTCTLLPTSSCLVNLSEWPPFVVTLDDIELVHFERVQFHIKNFDMVIIFKDYTRKPALITAIPMQMLEHVKNWLDSADIHFTEGIQSLNWVNIMKKINENPKVFLTDESDGGGDGWKFLEPEDTENNGDMEDEEEDDEYKGSESEDAGSGSDSEEYSEDSEVDEEEEDGDDASDASSGEESGKDWDELEAEAAKADRQKAMEEEQEVSRMPAKRPNQRFGGSGGTKRMRR